MNIRQIRNIVILGGIFLCIPIVFFILKFAPCKYVLSDTITDWGSFGDYFSGTIGIIVGLLNLVFFIFLTIEIAKVNDVNNLKNLNFERKRIMTELRYESIKRYEERVSSLLDNLVNYLHQQPLQAQNILWEILKTENYFNEFLITYSDIFPNMNGQLLATDITKIKNYISQNQNNRSLLVQFIDNLVLYKSEWVT
jgi:hypothetical protein